MRTTAAQRLAVGILACATLLSLAATGPVAAAPPPTPDARAVTRPVASGWITYWRLDDGLASTLAHAELFNDVAMYWYSATRRSTVVEQEPGSQPSQALLDQAVASLQAKGIRVFLTVNDEGFTASSMAGLLKDRQRRGLLIDNLVAKAQLSGADGIDIDFESMNSGSVGAARTAVKQEFPVFLGKLQTALHARDLRLSIALPARTGPRDDSWEVFDYRAIAGSVDRARVMTYDFHVMSGSPGPIAPIAWVDDVARFAAAHFGRKLSLGVPAYGYNWFVKRLSGTCPGSAFAPTSGSTRALVDVAKRENVTPTFVRAVAGSTFTYSRAFFGGGDSCRVKRTVWYEDSRSVAAKLTLLRRYHIRSMALWTLGGERAGTWKVLSRYAS